MTEPPELAGWRSVTVDTAPLAERMQTALGPCCENDIIFVAISWHKETKDDTISFMKLVAKTVKYIVACHNKIHHKL